MHIFNDGMHALLARLTAVLRRKLRRLVALDFSGRGNSEDPYIACITLSKIFICVHTRFVDEYRCGNFVTILQ